MTKFFVSVMALLISLTASAQTPAKSTLPATGLPATGLPATGLPATGLWATGLWATTGEITKTSANGYRVDAKIPVGEFAAYYDVLRNEKPVSLWVDYGSEPGLSQTVPIINFSLFTGEEPLGEGPQDTSN